MSLLTTVEQNLKETKKKHQDRVSVLRAMYEERFRFSQEGEEAIHFANLILREINGQYIEARMSTSSERFTALAEEVCTLYSLLPTKNLQDPRRIAPVCMPIRKHLWQRALTLLIDEFQFSIIPKEVHGAEEKLLQMFYWQQKAEWDLGSDAFLEMAKVMRDALGPTPGPDWNTNRVVHLLKNHRKWLHQEVQRELLSYLLRSFGIENFLLFVERLKK
jgi:hypothetical protein